MSATNAPIQSSSFVGTIAPVDDSTPLFNQQINKRRMDRHEKRLEGERKRIAEIDRRVALIEPQFQQGCELFNSQWFPAQARTDQGALDQFICEQSLPSLFDRLVEQAAAAARTIEQIMAHPEGRKQLARATAVNEVQPTDFLLERMASNDFVDRRNRLCTLRSTLSELDTAEHVGRLVLMQGFLNLHDPARTILNDTAPLFESE